MQETTQMDRSVSRVPQGTLTTFIHTRRQVNSTSCQWIRRWISALFYHNNSWLRVSAPRSLNASIFPAVRTELKKSPGLECKSFLRNISRSSCQRLMMEPHSQSRESCSLTSEHSFHRSELVDGDVHVSQSKTTVQSRAVQLSHAGGRHLSCGPNRVNMGWTVCCIAWMWGSENQRALWEICGPHKIMWRATFGPRALGLTYVL